MNVSVQQAWKRSRSILGVFASVILLEISPAVAQDRVITAHVVAIDQVYFYNRFGSFNPVGMMYALRRDVVDSMSGLPIGLTGGVPGRVMLRPDKRPRPLVLRANVGDTLEVHFTNLLSPTRPPDVGPPEPGETGGDAPRTRIASIVAAGLTPLGDNSDPYNTGISGIAPGQSITYRWKMEREGTHLLFSNGAPAGGEGDGGSVVLGLFGVINVEPAGSRWYRSQVTAAEMKAARDQATGSAFINYEAVDLSGTPILNILKGNEIVHSDLNAIITGFTEPDDGVEATQEGPFREFTVVIHDELKTVHGFELLDTNEQLHGARDGHGINYGASGIGGPVLSNRLGIGPAKDCVECAFEEFFLSSWPVGDPALLPQYPDDPSHVHHSYLNDKVKIRNLHAGPKEVHVFHLHAHQWLAQTDGENSTYLDSQSIGPQQGFTYEIVYGGSGNRNLTPGDAIFHCHLYPHFAQGLWALWRVHDVFEDGTRALPDGEWGPGTDPYTGITTGGTPIPAIVPMPGQAMPPQPTYGPDGMPGYPFYIPGKAGHRPPQPPLEMVVDGGLPRHIITGGTRTVGGGVAPANDFTIHLTTSQIQLIEPDGTPLEKNAMAFHAAPNHPTTTPEGAPSRFVTNGRPPQPGAPYADPCPLNPKIREYHVSAIQLDLVVNKYGWHDPQARINVLDSDVAQHEGQKRTADPFFFRAHSGECVLFYHTNRTPEILEKDDFQVRTPTDTIGQHIHLVKFDVTSSDGAANGWNYEDGTFSRGAIVERINASKAPGGSATRWDGTPVILNATNGFQTTLQRWFADPLLNKAGQDRTIRTVFTHDHFSPSSIQQHGFYSALVIEPEGSRWLTPQGGPLVGGVGAEAMIVGATDQVTHPDHREFMLAVADFALIYTPEGRPVNPPIDAHTGQPLIEIISAHDPGTFLINYKQEPIPLRLSPTGGLPLYPDARGDMAYVFSSVVHKDPFTPIFKAYEGDRIQVRLIQGSQEEGHTFSIHGMRWRHEISNPNSRYVPAQDIGISEHFEMDVPHLPKVLRGANYADYLYKFEATEDLWTGVWGLIRTFSGPSAIDPATGTPVSLAPLPNSSGRVTAINEINFRPDGCPTTAPIRSFSVEAWAAKDLLPGGAIVYNQREGITDPSGLLYVLASDVPSLRAGTKKVEPLVLRANAGDCIKVRLANKLPAAVPDHPGDATMIPITALNSDDFRPSNKVSLHPQLLSYDIRVSDGANVGYNQIQTASPGGTAFYTWYAGVISLDKTPSGYVKNATPVEFGSINLQPFGDVIKQGMQGLVGALIIEPQGSVHLDPVTNMPITSGTAAKICVVTTCFKEFVLVYQASLNLLENGALMPDNFIGDDPGDTGEKGLNYRTEPFCTRLGLPANCDTNNSVYPPDFMLGPIETPLFSASPGDATRFRIVWPFGAERQRGFLIYGHDYPDMGLPNFGSSGSSPVTVGKPIDAHLYDGAKAGIWIYRDGPSHMFASGSWGRFEVK